MPHDFELSHTATTLKQLLAVAPSLVSPQQWPQCPPLPRPGPSTCIMYAKPLLELHLQLIPDLQQHALPCGCTVRCASCS